MNSNVVALRRNERVEQWVTAEQFRRELANHLGGRVPSDRWLRERISKDGLPSDKFLGRRMVPLERGIGWLRERGLIP